MDSKKRVVVLVVIAIVLAIIAIAMQFSDSDVSTTRSSGSSSDTSKGLVGLVVRESLDVEDRGNQDSGGSG